MRRKVESALCILVDGKVNADYSVLSRAVVSHSIAGQNDAGESKVNLFLLSIGMVVMV